jgi:hypothetical protein
MRSTEPGCGIAWPMRCRRWCGSIRAAHSRYRGVHRPFPVGGSPGRVPRRVRRHWQLRELSHDEDPPIALLRARIQALPREAIESVDRRAPIVIARLFQDEPAVTEFRKWAISADPAKLLAATRVLSGSAGRFVKGRSRGRGKRSSIRLEPGIMGKFRGVPITVEAESIGSERHRGGRPRAAAHQHLVMHLAVDWLYATGKTPMPGRSDLTGFGDLVHSVFQWLSLPEGSATYALRRYWADVEMVKAREPLADFLKRYDEKL